jgi:hypothetical protein
VLTAGRRCSRRRLGVGGGAASVSVFTAASRSGPAPPRSRMAPPSSGSSRPRQSSAATRRRRRGARSSSVPPSSSSTLPSLSPIGGAALERGQNPNVGWWDAVATPGPSIESWSRRCRGKEKRGSAPISGHGAAADVEPHQWVPGAFGVTKRGQRGQIPLADSPDPGRALTQPLGVRASSPPAIPSRARDAGRRGAVELVAERGKG